MFCSEHIESVYGWASSYTLDGYQESLQISPGHNHLWTEIHCRECEAPWLLWCTLGWQGGGSQKHIRMLLLPRFSLRPALGIPSEYRQLIEALMFLVNPRPDICFVVNTLSQFMVEPHHIHWMAAKNLFKYLRGIITYGLRYIFGDVMLHGYSDAD